MDSGKQNTNNNNNNNNKIRLHTEDKIIEVSRTLALKIPFVANVLEYIQTDSKPDQETKDDQSTTDLLHLDDDLSSDVTKIHVEQSDISVNVPPAFLEHVIDYIRNKYSTSYLKTQLSQKWENENDIIQWFGYLGFDPYSIGYEYPFSHKVVVPSIFDSDFEEENKVDSRTVIINAISLKYHNHDLHHNSCSGSYSQQSTKSLFVFPDRTYGSHQCYLTVSNTVHYVIADEIIVDGKIDRYFVRQYETGTNRDVSTNEVFKVNGKYYMKMADYLKHDFYDVGIIKTLFAEIEIWMKQRS
jgi:hypothetical protein